MIEIPEAPEWISDRAAEHWPELLYCVIANRTYSENYDMTLGLLCESIADMQFLQDKIREEGLTVPGADGNVKAHPALRQLESVRAQVFKGMESFGLTAKSRKHVKEERIPDPNNPWAKYKKA